MKINWGVSIGMWLVAAALIHFFGWWILLLMFGVLLILKGVCR